jgi:hypothetical protein
MKKVNEVCKAFGKDVEEATQKLQTKFKGFCILHPEFTNAELDYDAGSFVKADGTQGAWAKLFQEIEVEDTPVKNHPEMKQKKPKKAKVAA